MKKTRSYLLILVVAVIATIAIMILDKDQEKKDEIFNKAVTADSTNILWYKDAVIYTLDVEVFKDSNGDGIGDFRGLTSKLGYLDSLGINVIWLAPFQPTPNQDDGYDVSDFVGIDKRLGTIDDFRIFMLRARKRNIRVIMDLVLNHTSIEHPWFQQARKNAASPFRLWYTWSKKKPANYNVGMVFPGVQKETWTYDSVAREYYYHRFYTFQPDINVQNPAVQTELRKIIKYWIDQGMAGFRLDAVPFFIEVPKTKGDKFDHQFEILTQLRAYLKTLNKDAIILGEANVPPKETKPYFGTDGNAMQMMFNFYVNQHLFYSLATGDVKPLRQALQATQQIPKISQWGLFLRNHDELDLGRLSKRARNRVYDKFGPQKNMQLYERGIRRRLAPMMNNNMKQLELAYSVLFSLPGTPVIRYGDEIGMGDNLVLNERSSVRTPMQWDTAKNGGFSTGDNTIMPVIDSGSFGYKTVNVLTEQKQPRSLLNWTRKIISVHKQCPEISFGNSNIVETSNSHLLAMRYEWQGTVLLVIHNFSKDSQKLSLKKGDAGGSKLKNFFSSGDNLKTGKDNLHFALEGYGYRWYKVSL